MPKIKIDHIISFSSEDPVHVANNILSSNNSKKWKCQNPGEKNAVVVLQLEKASVISGIDIGNEHSAYVEVLVSRSGTNEDYKVLLVASSFMTPLEARQSQNVNKVRMFTKEHFSKPECEEKWDRIKIVCTQPFNKQVQYGLSFINVHGKDDKTAAPVQTQIGKFILRPESPDNLSVGSLFEKQKHEKQEEKLKGAAAIREASSFASLALHGSPVCKPKLKTSNTTTSNSKTSLADDEVSKPRNRNELLYNKDEEEPNEKIDKLIENKIKESKDKESKLEKETPKRKMIQDNSKRSSKKEKKENGNRQSPVPLDVSINTPGSSKKRKTSNEEVKGSPRKKTKKELMSKPFVQLLEGVTLVISGIQNPDRANLRTQALSMGAKYKPDWDNTCTHLICAFRNTPKFNQVKGKGKIVKREWLEECYSQRKKLPWRRYALDKNDASKAESEDEVCERIESSSVSRKTELLHKTEANNDSDTDCGEHNDVASDTEEKVAKILELQGKQNKNQKDIYNADTDEESPIEKVSSDFEKNLTNIFEGKHFYIDNSFDMEIYNKLVRYIVAYNGKWSDDPTENIDIIITKRESSKTLKEVNKDALCISPEWIWDCHNSQKLVPVDEYVC